MLLLSVSWRLRCAIQQSEILLRHRHRRRTHPKALLHHSLIAPPSCLVADHLLLPLVILRPTMQVQNLA
jgi:hypothetical protein